MSFIIKSYYICIRNKLDNMFSKACEYGIRATIYVVQQSGAGIRVGLKDIANAIGSPEAFTAKILQQLVRDNIIRSAKGPNGGFFVEEEQLSTVRLSDLVTAIDGDEVYKGCGLGLSDCNAARPCPLHDKFARIRSELRNMLESTKIGELTEGLTQKLTWLNR